MSRFRVALIGTSFARLVQAVGFQRHAGFELVAIAGSQQEKTRRIAGELSIPGAYSDWREMLARERPDVVSIVTPVDLHHPMMMAALEAGCHVLCEKPTALHRHQAAEMRDRARAAGRVAGMNHEFRFFPARREALAMVKRGAIGVPRRGEIIGRYPIWATPGSRGMTWLSRRERGGGILGALGSHHTDSLRQFFGEPLTVLGSVRVDQPQRGPTADGGETGIATADDACTMHYTFADGASAIVDLSACVPYRFERFDIHGSEASLRWEDSGYTLWRIVAGKEPEVVPIASEHQLTPREGDPALVAPFGALLDRFHRALSGDGPMEPGFDDGVAVQSALDAVRLSSAAGSEVTVQIPAPLEAAAASNA